MSVLKEVPENVSQAYIVEQYWPTVIASIFDGFPIETHLEFIEKILTERKALIEQGLLDDSFDWKGDLEKARSKQRENLQWIPAHQATRQGHLDYWLSLTSRVEEYAEKLALSGMSLIVGFHGAVALGAIKILSEKNAIGTSAVWAAKFALPFAIIGIILCNRKISCLSYFFRTNPSYSPG